MRKEPPAFRHAVAFAAAWFNKHLTLDDAGAPWRIEPSTFDLCLELGIFWLQPRPERPVAVPTITESSALALLDRCQSDPAAWDLARRISAHCLAHDIPLPQGLRRFAACYLAQTIEEPKRRRRSAKWQERFACLLIIRVIERLYSLSATRTDTAQADGFTRRRKGDGFSACDVVSVALRSFRGTTRMTYAALKALKVNNSEVELRRDVDRFEKGLAALLEYNLEFADETGFLDVIPLYWAPFFPSESRS